MLACALLCLWRNGHCQAQAGFPADARVGRQRVTRAAQGGYAIWNLMAPYRLGPRWTLALNVNNLFDKTCYRTVAGTTGGNFYGEPRNWMLTLRGKF